MTLREAFTVNGIDGYLTSSSEEKLEELCRLLTDYTSRVNLTAVTDREGIYVKHFADSALILKYVKSGAAMLDVGCGGGFPSLPCAILRDDITVLSMDSTEKKLRFIQAASSALGLSNINTVAGRAEELCVAPLRESFDIVTARAVAFLPVLCELCLPYVKTGGIFIAMKTDDTENEASRHAVSALGCRIRSVERLKLKSGDQAADRCITVIEKVKSTDKKYPRRYPQIKAKSL